MSRTSLKRYLRRHPGVAIAHLFVLVVLVLAAVGPALAPYNPTGADLLHRLSPPSAHHWFGTDSSGLDVFSRVISAPRVDVAIAAGGVAISLIVGVAAGLLAAYYDTGLGGVLGQFILRITDMVQAFPVFVLAMALVASAGQRIDNVIYAIAFVNIPFYLRIVYTQARALRRRAFVDSARVSGVGSLTILRRHLLPNSLAPILAQVSINVGWAILLTAGLSFAGAGVRAPTPEWGLMISQGVQDIVTGQWWTSVFPGLALTLTVFCLALAGQSIEDLLDPRRAGEYEIPTTAAELTRRLHEQSGELGAA